MEKCEEYLQMESQMIQAEKDGDDRLADKLWHQLRRMCPCGRGNAYPQTDAYGIYAGRMCDDCFRETYRQDFYFDPDYAGESLDPV